MWGENKTNDQKMWGGEGHDYIVGGDKTKEQFLFGNDGNDEILPGSQAKTKVVAKGGKGWDLINAVGYGEEDFAKANAEEEFWGGDGEDEIWGGE